MMNNLLTRGMQRSVFAAATLVTLASAGCDRSTTPGAAIAPAPVPAAVAVITTGPGIFNPFASCATAAFVTPNLNLVITSATDVTVDEVTLHLLDGSNVGGPGITVPPVGLNGSFANTVVRAGTSRTFVLSPTFSCGVVVPHSIRSDVELVDPAGVRTMVTATVPLS
jgi:hypothetical protein